MDYTTLFNDAHPCFQRYSSWFMFASDRLQTENVPTLPAIVLLWEMNSPKLRYN